MKRHVLMMWCAAVAIAPAVVTADTLHLKDGTTLDGVVTRINDNCIAIQSGNGQIIYQNDEFDRIEENDKKGTLDLARQNPAALRHEQALEKATGLKAEQRNKLIALVDRLAREDMNERNEAIKELVALNQQIDVYRFLKESRQGFGARVLPGVFEVMLTLNKAETKTILYDNLDNMVPGIRAAVLELLGKHRELASLETVARGLVDEQDEVRIAACHALAELGDGRATPALISVLSSPNPRVKNAGNAALSRIWSKEDKPVQFETAAQWEALWKESNAQVGKPIELASLKPLFVLPEGSYVIVHE